jgi:hypothetical protein
MEGATGAEDCRRWPACLHAINPRSTEIDEFEWNIAWQWWSEPWSPRCCNPSTLRLLPPVVLVPNSPFTANSEPSASSFLENTSWPGLATAAPVHSTCSRAGAWVLFYSSRCHAAPVSCQVVTRFWLSLGRSSTASLFSTVLFAATLDVIRGR